MSIILDVKGECDFCIILVVSCCLMCILILFIIDGGILWKCCLNGVLFDNFMWCFING